MNLLTITEAVPPQNLNLDTGIPLYIMLPLIMVIAIVSVVGIRWLYRRGNKS